MLVLAPMQLPALVDPEIFLVRGDANNDGIVNGSDATYINSDLFQGGPAPSCKKAADANDDGVVDNSDTIYLLYFLYYGGPPPVSPFPECGEDSTTDILSCNDSQCND
jgi:hypothetical protein